MGGAIWVDTHIHYRCYAVLCPTVTLCNPTDCSPPGSPVHGISQVRILEWVAISSSRESSPQASNSRLLHWQADSLLPHHLGIQSNYTPVKLNFKNLLKNFLKGNVNINKWSD